MKTFGSRAFNALAGACCLLLFWLSGCATHVSPLPPMSASIPPPAPPPRVLQFTATAYSIDGTTAAGDDTRPGIVAADPDVLPIGSRIRVLDAGAYSGVYVVKDTGRKINGHHIDIYIPNHRRAKRFGKKTVHVEMLRPGEAGENGATR